MCNRVDFGVGLRFGRCGDGDRSFPRSRFRSFSLSLSSFRRSPSFVQPSAAAGFRSVDNDLLPPRGGDLFTRDGSSFRFGDGDLFRSAVVPDFFISVLDFDDARFPDAVCFGEDDERPEFDDELDELDELRDDELVLRLVEPEDDDPEFEDELQYKIVQVKNKRNEKQNSRITYRCRYSTMNVLVGDGPGFCDHRLYPISFLQLAAFRLNKSYIPESLILTKN